MNVNKIDKNFKMRYISPQFSIIGQNGYGGEIDGDTPNFGTQFFYTKKDFISTCKKLPQEFQINWMNHTKLGGDWTWEVCFGIWQSDLNKLEDMSFTNLFENGLI